MTLRINEPTLQGISREIQPEIYKGLDAIAHEFPDGWELNPVPEEITDNIKLILTASAEGFLPPGHQTVPDVQKAVRGMFENLTKS